MNELSSLIPKPEQGNPFLEGDMLTLTWTLYPWKSAVATSRAQHVKVYCSKNMKSCGAEEYVVCMNVQHNPLLEKNHCPNSVIFAHKRVETYNLTDF